MRSDTLLSSFSRGIRFPTTKWSLIVRGVEECGIDPGEALNELCLRYRGPLYAFARRKGFRKPDAEDQVQAFLATMTTDPRQGIGRANRERGRFRTFLLKAFEHAMSNSIRSGRAKKRGGAQTFVSLDEAEEAFVEGLSANSPSPQQAYDACMAFAIVTRAYSQVRQHYDFQGNAQVFDVLKPFIMGEQRRGDIALASKTLRMSSNACHQAVHRLRSNVRTAFYKEVRELVSDPTIAEDEAGHLLEALRDGHAYG